MNRRISCPECEASLSVRNGERATAIRCPDCGATFTPTAPRRARPRGSSGAGTILIVGLVMGGGALALIVLAVLAFVVLKPSRTTTVPGGSTAAVASTGASATGDGRTAPAIDGPPTGKYIPRVSEKKLLALMEQMRKEHGENGEREITEKQVYELMGTPTSREAPVTVQRNGMTITFYEARWKQVEGEKLYETVITFMNGRFGGGIIGAEFTPSKSDRPAPGQFKPPAGTPGNTIPVQLSRDPAALVIGWWDAEIPGSYQPNRRKVHKLRIEFNKDGTCQTTEYGNDGMSINSTQGNWRVDRSEANLLYIELNLRIPLTTEAIAIGNPVLLQFKNDHEWETRGLLGGNTSLMFRRR